VTPDRCQTTADHANQTDPLCPVEHNLRGDGVLARRRSRTGSALN